MQQLPKISIVIPSFNQADFIEETIKSVLDQEYPYLELIVIDGASTDQSAAIIKRYEDRLTYWVSEPDKGQTDALCKGFEKATGEIMGWLCSDDLLKSGSLDLAAALFRLEEKFDVIYGDTEYLYPDGWVQPKPRVSYDYEIMLRSFNLIPQPSSFFTRAIYEKVGGLDRSLHYAMDYDLFLRFGRDAKVRHFPVMLSTYRLHASSKTVSDKPKFHAEWDAVRSRMLGRPLGMRDVFARYYYLAKVVLKFGIERGLWKFRYDNRKYKISEMSGDVAAEAP